VSLFGVEVGIDGFHMNASTTRLICYTLGRHDDRLWARLLTDIIKDDNEHSNQWCRIQEDDRDTFPQAYNNFFAREKYRKSLAYLIYLLAIWASVQ